ncbi:MAG: hypothetical protein KDJ30_18625 [Rhodoblastus sp.]|nr:hypothetical protein [Rhodoblastus sp.]
MLSVAVITLIGVGLRLVMMMAVQRRREKLNRQINERLRTLIAAYKTLGGSFTGDLLVDPRHLRDLTRVAVTNESAGQADSLPGDGGSDRARRIRDAVEAALSDIILLGTEEQVRLAARAAIELTAGNPAHTHELVISLRNFIRDALDLDPLPLDLAIPMQGPARSTSAGGRGKGGKDDASGGRGGAGGMGVGMGMGMSMGMGMGGGTGDGLNRQTLEAEDPVGSGHRP